MQQCPTITLKKGKLELQIKNAAAVIKKIEEMYPDEIYKYSPSSERNREHDKQKRFVISAKNWFKETMFGGTEDFEVIVNNKEPKSNDNDECDINLEQLVESLAEEENQPKIGIPTPQPVLPEIPLLTKTVNKNAYEIRLEVLQSAIRWASMEPNMPKAVSAERVANGDSIIELAQKFYRFVENRK